MYSECFNFLRKILGDFSMAPNMVLGTFLFAWKQYIFFSFLNAMFYKSQLHLVGWMCLDTLYYSDFFLFVFFFNYWEKKVKISDYEYESLCFSLLFFQFS